MSTTLLLPPELRLLTGHLTTLAPAQLLPLLPALTSHALRCREILLRPVEQKPPGYAAAASSSAGTTTAAEAANLVLRLRSSIASLLNGRAPEGRLVGAALAKTVLDVGGLEALKGTESWVRGLLVGLQVSLPSTEMDVLDRRQVLLAMRLQ